MKTILLIVSSLSLVACSYAPTNVRTYNQYGYTEPVVSDSYYRVVPRYSQTRVDCDYIISPRNPGDYPPYRRVTPPVYFCHY